jgi:hypothetical protein
MSVNDGQGDNYTELEPDGDPHDSMSPIPEDEGANYQEEQKDLR